MKNKFITNTIPFLLAVSFLFFNLTYMTWYIFYGYQINIFHSDSAVKVLLAQEILTTGEYFPSEWNYVNSDLMVLFGHTFIVPLLTFLPAGYFVHSVSGLISAILILSGVWFVTSLLEISKTKRVMITAVLAAGMSGILAENLYGQVSYGTVLYLTCYIIYFAWGFLSSTHQKKVLFGLGVSFLIILTFWSNPQRGIVTYGIPLLITTIYYIFRKEHLDSSMKKSYVGYQLIGVIILSIFVGMIFHSITLNSVANTLRAGNASWLSFNNIIHNIIFSLKGFLAIFGGVPGVGRNVISGIGLYESIRLISALMLLFLMPLSIRYYLNKKFCGSTFVSLFSLTALFLVLFIQFFTTVPDMSDPVQSSRYLIPSLLLMLILVLAHPYDFEKEPIVTVMAVIVSMVLITSSYPSFVKSNKNSAINWDVIEHHKQASNIKNNYAEIKNLIDLNELKDILLANELHYGYATYWNAGVMSVISSEQVLVRQISFNKGIPKPMRHLSSNRWYRPDAWNGETFLMLTEREVKKVNWNYLEKLIGKPVRTLQFDGFRIVVYPENIAKNLSDWDRSYANKISFHVSNLSSHNIGTFYENYADGSAALVAEKGEAGALHYGPNIQVEPGTYNVTFDISSDSITDGNARLDIVSERGKKVFAKKLITATDEPVTLKITIEEIETLEFRVWSLGRARVVFNSVSIVRA